MIFALLPNLAYIWLCNCQNHVKYMLYGVNCPVESIAGVFECLGVIVRTVWVAKHFTSGFLATMECVFVLSELCAYSYKI